METSGEIRADASGAVHAIAAGGAFLGVNVKAIEESYYDLLIMRKCTAKCVEYSNDILSHNKEAIEIKKKLGASASLTDIKAFPAFNIVQIMWQHPSGVAPQFALGQAFLEAQNAHNALMKDFFIHKKSLITKMESERQAIENPSSDNPSKLSKADLEKRHSDVKKYISALEGWLAHPWWAFITPRYNLGYTSGNASTLTSLQGLAKETP